MNIFINLDDLVWHIKGLTKWRLIDKEGWPKRINSLFPSLPNYIDTAYLMNNFYYFTKVKIVKNISIKRHRFYFKTNIYYAV